LVSPIQYTGTGVAEALEQPVSLSLGVLTQCMLQKAVWLKPSLNQLIILGNGKRRRRVNNRNTGLKATTKISDQIQM